MSEHEYDPAGLSLTIDGVPFAVEAISYKHAAPPEGAATDLLRGASGSFEVTMDLEGEAAEEFWSAIASLVPPPRFLNASYPTLARRWAYGGRKGRSAFRRLVRAGLAWRRRGEEEVVALLFGPPFAVPEEGQ